MSTSLHNRPMPVPSVSHLQLIWGKLSTADRISLLGHSADELQPEDSMRLMGILADQRKSK